jgi:hypothetical protein
MTPTELVSRDPGTLTAHENRLATNWLTKENEIRQLTRKLAEAHEEVKEIRAAIQAIGMVTA